jgi:3-deoxy-D-manno-octulosonate 8-phosphate phosphatase (KDO 8-P phosphatase)
MKKLSEGELKERAARVRLLILDVDGVLTDCRIIFDNEGNEFKAFHVRDGHGIKMVQREGIPVALITGRTSRVVERRAVELGITEVHQGSKKKIIAFREVMEKFGVTEEEVAYMGDDVVDLPVMARVGLSAAPADAAEEAKDFAGFVTKNNAGRGAARELTDLLLKARGRWDAIIKDYTEV